MTAVVAQDLFGNSSYWRPVLDGDPTARALADRHYSRKTRGAPLFMGPGQKLVLLGADRKAVFGWRYCRYRGDGQEGIECTIFRNEGDRLSSELIREAMEIAWQVWPGARLFTYVNASKVRSSNPGCCFKKAGWKRCGKSQEKDLLLFEVYPSEQAERSDSP